MKLNIITRCTRPHNLLKVKQSLLNKKCFQIKWWIIFDSSKISSVDTEIISELYDSSYILDIKFMKSISGAYGNDLINLVLSEIDGEEWVYVLDDDNLLHPKIEDIFNYQIDKTIIVFNQYVGGKDFTKLDVRMAIPENMKVQGVDSAQCIIQRKMLKNFPLHYTADGMVMEYLHTKFPNQFLYIDQILSTYNAIESDKYDSSPKVLLLGLDEEVELRTVKYAPYESDSLKILQKKDDSNINEVLSNFNPDSIVTIGESFCDFPNLNNMSLDIRRRWLHFNEFDNSIGESSYLCATNYILSSDDSNPLVSIFTPIYNTGEKLRRTYESIKNQSYTNWEWVVVNDSTDGGSTLKIAEDISKTDVRVKVYDFKVKSKGIVGESKYRAASLCSGKYLLELDHDDYLTNQSLYWVVEAFKNHKDCKFVYSDCAEIYENHQSLTYDAGFAFGYGSYRDEICGNITYKAMNSPNINPKTIRHIVGVPNHLRAWDRVFYHSIGGHNRRLPIADDYELIVRTFLKTKMVRIPKLLYLQFYHDNNTQNSSRADIQRRVRSISSFYNEQIKDRFRELGYRDWAYEGNNQNPIMVESKFGEEECAVNYIFGESRDIVYNEGVLGLKYLF